MTNTEAQQQEIRNALTTLTCAYLLGENGLPTHRFGFMCELLAAVGEDELPRLARAHKLNYTTFLDTLYWKAVARQVKKLAGDKCVKCHSINSLRVHHLNYNHRWKEHLHLDSLECLCGMCHHQQHQR